MQDLVNELARIVQTVAFIDQPYEQVDAVVEAISAVMQVDVCTLYECNSEEEMELLASHGLARRAVRSVKIPRGKGLVGLVASSRHPINVTDAQSHPDYYYIASTKEESFHGFCGVPLVHAGKTIGVLVVQVREPRIFDAEEESFLVTLAAQLTLILVANPAVSMTAGSVRQCFVGVKGSAGVGVGQAHLVDMGELYSVVDSPCKDIDAALGQWAGLVAQVKLDLMREQTAVQGALSSDVSGIFSAYAMLLDDPLFNTHVQDTIKAGHWLPTALKRAVKYFAEQFLAMDDPYLRSRHEDIHHLGNKLFNVWKGHNDSQLTPTGKVVLVGAQVSISSIAAIPPEQLAGIICFDGSSLSHTAVVANALGIPAVLGTGVIRGVEEGSLLVVDGSRGEVWLEPDAIILDEYRQLTQARGAFAERLSAIRELPGQTTDGQTVTLFTNTGLLADISPGLQQGAEGVGLYRTEIPFMIHHSFPTEDEQVEVYRKVLEAYRGKPVCMRTLDIGGDKQLPYFPITNEENPALGWRGIRFSLDNSPLLMTQVRAMLRASEGIGNLRILLPMVSTSSELDDFRDILSDALSQLAVEGYAIDTPALGVMIEVPAAISQIPFWRDQVDFLSVGSNDLSQYLLALDRNNPRVASRYDHVHPAVLLELQRIVQLSTEHGLPISVCGEMASDPVAVILLLGLGVRTISMSASRLPRIKWMIRHFSMADAEALTARALTMKYPADIRRMVSHALEGNGLTEILA